MDYEHNELVMSDIPGCGVGALEHVYHKLDREYHGEFELAPLPWSLTRNGCVRSCRNRLF